MKNLFSFRLFREGLRQLRMPGLIFFAIYALEAILIPLSAVFTDHPEGKVIAEVVSGIETHPICLSNMYVVAPVLTVVMFGFLNRRNASDFYHSLPFSRQSIFFSFLSAVAAWMAVIVFGSGLISVLMHLVLSRYFTLMLLSTLLLQLECLIGGLLVAAAFALAMTITGTLFNNMIIACLILFFPCYAILMVTSTVVDALPMLSGELPVLLSSMYNIVVSPVVALFTGSDMVFGGGCTMSTHLFAMLYTLLLAAIYTALGTYLFCRRKSEAASISAPTRRMQAVFRIVLVMPICMGVCAMMIRDWWSGSSGHDWFGYVILYIIAAVVYFVYELITTRKWRNLVSALPGLGVVALLNLVVLGMMHGVYVSELNYTPEKDEIRGIRFRDSIGNSKVLEFSEYASLLGDEIKITDPEALQIVSDRLQQFVEDYREKGRSGFWAYYDSAVYRECVIEIDAGGFTRVRRIPLNAAELEVLLDALEAHPEAKALWTTLPTPQKNTMYLFNQEFSNEQMDRLYKTMEREIATIDFNKWYLFCNDSTAFYSFYNNGVHLESLDHLNYDIEWRMDTYTFRVPIHPIILPETSKCYLEIIQEIFPADPANAEMMELLDRVPELIASKEEGKEGHLYLNLGFYLQLPEQTVQLNQWMSAEEGQEKIREVIEFLKEKQATVPEEVGVNYVDIEIEVNESDGSWYVYSVQLPLKEITLEELPELLKEHLREYLQVDVKPVS